MEWIIDIFVSFTLCSLARELQKNSKSANAARLPHGQRSIMVGTKRVQAATINTEGGAVRSGRKKRIRNKQLISLTEDEYNDIIANVYNPEMTR